MAGLLGREDYFNVHFLREQWERDKQEEGAKWLCRAGLTPRGLSGVKDHSSHRESNCVEVLIP